MNSLDKLIGNTPMIRIDYEFQGKQGSVYSKLESYNLTGSIKDRMAYYILKCAKENGVLKEGQPIIEATSGNTGISFAAIGAYFHHPVIIFMPDWMSEERKHLMRLYGADLRLISKEEGGFLACIEQADKLASEIDGFRPNQFANLNNVAAHYYSTGREILKQLPDVGGFVSGIGTGGTLIGIGKYLKEKNAISLFALEPDDLPILTKGITTGVHKIEGIGDDFIPEIVDRDLIDEVFSLDDDDAIVMSQKLGRELGLGVGISSGANFLASVLANEKGVGKIATVFPDDNKKYLTTDLTSDIDKKDYFLSSQIKLIGYEVI